MVALKIEFSKRTVYDPDRSFWQALDDGKVSYAVFDIEVGPNSKDFQNERDFRLELLSDYVQQGYRVWNIKRRKGKVQHEED